LDVKVAFPRVSKFEFTPLNSNLVAWRRPPSILFAVLAAREDQMSSDLQYVGEELHRRPAQAIPDSYRPAVTSVDLDEELALLIGELNHRIRNLLTMAEAVIRQTRSPTVEDYRAQVVMRISALRRFHEMDIPHGAALDLAELLEQTLRPYCADSNQVFATGPDLELQPKLALVLHLVFHELAMNAKKYGALSSPLGSVKIQWESGHIADAARQLAIIWTEHGGPEVKHPQYFGFGSRLIASAVQAYGDVQMNFEIAGLVCRLRIDLDHDSNTRTVSATR
jgi:two-component sensor histidine kinase